MSRLQILFLEDNPLDAEVVKVTLKEGGFDCELRQVETRDQFIAALMSDRFSLILADYAVPGFDGLTALEITLDLCPEVPFIFVSGTMGEELAIESLKKGATDYVLKQRLERLVPCVQRALKEAQKKQECRQIARALRESEAQFRSFAENSNEVIWITDSREYRLIYVSPSYEKLWGRSSEEIYADLNNFLTYIHPEDRDRVREAWQQCSQEGFVQEYRILRPDGSTIWIRDRGFPIYDDLGNLLWLGGIAEDITKQKQTEESLQKNQEELEREIRDIQRLQQISSQLIQENEVNCLYESILDTAITLMNSDMGSLQVLDPESNELELLIWIGFDPASADCWERVGLSSDSICGRALQTSKRILITDVETCDYITVKEELDAYRISGIRAVQSTPLISRKGHLVGMISTHWQKPHQPLERELNLLDVLARQAADALERKQGEIDKEILLAREQSARIKAEEVNRIKDEFLAIVSHELRSPLSPILGWSTLLQTQKLNPIQVTQALEVIARNAKLQAKLIEDLLNISRILRGKLSLEITEVNLVSTINSAMETVRLASQSKSIQIHTNFKSNAALVSGDPNRLQQVFWNLLSNAIKFTPEGGRVDISQENLGSTAQITISDTGKGIDPNFLPYVFDYFSQENGATTRKYGGLGLGLAIVRHLVELHGGTIEADSLGEGHGATFTVTLPLKHSSSPTPDNYISDEPALDLNGIEILIVDDDSDTLELMTFLLEQSGAIAIAVDCASEALDVLTDSLPDILLSDIAMPEIDGYMLMRQIRALPPEQGGQIPAIALTAFAGEIDSQRATSAGFQQHLTKPVELDKLLKAITSLVK